MKKFAWAFLAGSVMFVFLPASLQAEVPKRIAWIGVHRAEVVGCEGETCRGNVATCEDGEWLLSTRSTITYMEGVCDDGDPTLPNCAGRLTFINESCRLAHASGGETWVGAVRVIRERFKGRMCFDPDAVSDCIGSLPDNVVVISEYAGHSRLRDVYTVSAEEETVTVTGFPYQGTARSRPSVTRPFSIDGKTVQLSMAASNLHWTAQRGFVDCAEANQALGQPPGCGIAGEEIVEPTCIQCCADCDGDGQVQIHELVTGVGNALSGCSE